MEMPDPAATAAAVQAELDAYERQLIQLTREGSAGRRILGEVIAELTAFSKRLRPHYLQIQEMLERRDLTYELVAGLEKLRKHLLWLYRRSRLEQIFYNKLRLERTLRDTLYRQILEAYDEFSSMESTESHVRGLPDDLLAEELMREELPAVDQ